MAIRKKTSIGTIWVVILLVVAVAVIVVFIIFSNFQANKAKITENYSMQLAVNYFGSIDTKQEVTRLASFEDGWCFGVIPKEGAALYGGTTLCIDMDGQGYAIPSYMPPPHKDQRKLSGYVSALQWSYFFVPKFTGQKSVDIKVDLVNNN